MLRGETQETIAADQSCSRQRVSQICRKIERWLATHPNDELAAALRLRCQRRLDELYRAAMRQFQRSKQDLVTERERTSHRVPDDKPEQAVTTTVHERVRRQQNGDARFLNAALRAVERMAAVCREPRAEGATGRQGDEAMGRTGDKASSRYARA